MIARPCVSYPRCPRSGERSYKQVYAARVLANAATNRYAFATRPRRTPLTPHAKVSTEGRGTMHKSATLLRVPCFLFLLSAVASSADWWTFLANNERANRCVPVKVTPYD